MVKVIWILDVKFGVATFREKLEEKRANIEAFFVINNLKIKKIDLI